HQFNGEFDFSDLISRRNTISGAARQVQLKWSDDVDRLRSHARRKRHGERIWRKCRGSGCKICRSHAWAKQTGGAADLGAHLAHDRRELSSTEGIAALTAKAAW